MAVPANVILVWPSTNASIPANYSRETTLDAKYLLGSAASTDPNTTGGSTTHTHTATDHTHTQNSHTHTVSSNGPTGTSSVLIGVTLNTVSNTHTHSANSASATATNQNATVTVNTASNDPPYYQVIFIKSNGTDDCPASSVVLLNSSSVPSGWTFCDGSSSTPDLRNRFLKGMTTGGDSGGTGGSSNAHAHTTNAHTHTQDAHTHSSSAISGITGAIQGSRIGSETFATRTHTHTVTFGSSVTATNQNTTATMQNGDGQPPWYKLLAIQNTSGGLTALPPYGIGFWLGTLASIPASLRLCDGTSGTPDLRDKFVKITNTSGELGNTGGATQHTHTSDSHTHTQDQHQHTVTAGNSSAGNNDYEDVGDPLTGVAIHPHTHSTWTAAYTTAVNQNTTITIQNNTASTNFPEYRTVAYLMMPGTARTCYLPVLGAG